MAALRRLGEAALVGLCAVALAAWGLGLHGSDLGLPLRYAPVDDGKFYLMLVKGIVEHGSYLVNHGLGFPFGQQLADYPQGADDLSLLMIGGLALFSSNPALVENLFFLLTFALAGASAYLVLRAEGTRAGPAAVAGLLFALLPYHFFRGESHLLLSAYYGIPLSAYLFLAVLGDRPLFARCASPAGRLGGRRLSWISARTAATVAICIVIGSDNLYYAVFAAVMLVGATLISLACRRPRAALAGIAALGLMATALAINLAPTFVAQAEHGTNPRLERSAMTNQRSDQALGLRLPNLILPPANDRIAPLARLGARYDRSIAPGYCEACHASLGVVGSAGLIWLTVCALAALATLAGARSWYATRRRFRLAAIGAGLAFAVGMAGGLSSPIERFVTPDIRAWNRISLLIAFFSLYAVALLLDSLARRWGRGRPGRAAAALVLGMVFAVGVYEQTSPADAPSRRADDREYRSDADFVAAIESRLPAGAAVFQLPYVPFPEGYPATPCCGPVPTYATKYEPLRGYLHSTSLRWSYGAVKGRPADWSAQLAGRPLSDLLPAVVSAGFDGLWLDPAGFTPARTRVVRAALTGALRQEPLLSPDRDLLFFDLRPYRARLRRTQSRARLALLRDRTLHPLVTECVTGGVAVVDPGRAPVAAELVVHRVGEAYRRRLLVVPGRTAIAVPRARTAAGRILGATLTDLRLEHLTPGPAGPVVGLTGPGCPR